MARARICHRALMRACCVAHAPRFGPQQPHPRSGRKLREGGAGVVKGGEFVCVCVCLRAVDSAAAALEGERGMCVRARECVCLCLYLCLCLCPCVRAVGSAAVARGGDARKGRYSIDNPPRYSTRDPLLRTRTAVGSPPPLPTPVPHIPAADPPRCLRPPRRAPARRAVGSSRRQAALYPHPHPAARAGAHPTRTRPPLEPHRPGR